MAVDRRAMIGLLLAGLLPGCAQAKAPAPFVDAYGFRRRFLDPSGRVVDSGNGGISHSEGQGYGMLLAEAEGDRAAFDAMWNWTRATLMRKDGLFSWRFDPRANPPVNDPNNATDGDILIAWALMRAQLRWNVVAYGDAARLIRQAILKVLVRDHGGRSILLPGAAGFAAAEKVTLNPSYYVWPALDAFARADGAPWKKLIGDGEALVRGAKFGPAQLPCDWVDLGADGRIRPAAGRPPRFGFDAVRVPLYLAWSGRRAMLAPYRAFWTDYIARLAPIPAWIDLMTGETAPYPLSAGGMAVVSLTVPKAPPAAPPGLSTGQDYYSSVLLSLVGLARSGRR